MKRLKLVFYVEEAADGERFNPATNKIAVEKLQMIFNVAETASEEEQLLQAERDAYGRIRSSWPKGQSLANAPPAPNFDLCFLLPELARDHLAEIRDVLANAVEAQKHGAPYDNQDRGKWRDINEEKKKTEEIFQCIGDMLSRTLHIKLRKWAKKQKELEPT